MSYDKELIEDRSACSVAYSNVTNCVSHSMTLRSSCKSAKCSAGRQCVSGKRRSTNLHLSCSKVLFGTKNFSVSDVSSLSKQSCVRVSHTSSTVLNSASSEIVSSNRNDNSVLVSARQVAEAQQSTKSTLSQGTKASLSLSQDTEASASRHFTRSTNGSLMARTLFKKTSLQQTLVSETNEHASSLRGSAFSYNGSEAHRSSALNEQTKLQQTSSSAAESRFFHRRYSPNEMRVERRLRYSGEFDNSLDAHTLKDFTQPNVFWSLFAWRKYLYFIISKPTHYDVELLDRINSYGKMKTTLLLILPLFLILLSGMWMKRDQWLPHEGFLKIPLESGLFISSPQNLLPPVLSAINSKPPASYNQETKKAKSPPSAVIETVEDRAIRKDENRTLDYQGLTKDEIKAIVREIIHEEALVQEQARRKQVQSDADAFESIQMELHQLVSKFNSLSNVLYKVKEEITSRETKMLQKDKDTSADKIYMSEISDKVQTLGKQFVILENLLSSAKNCCLNNTELDHKISAALLSILSDSGSSNPMYKLLMEWFLPKFVSNEQLNKEFLAVKASEAEGEAKLKAFIQENLETMRQNLLSSSHAGESVSMNLIRKLVKEAIQLYDSDKTGLADYALESGGGAVVNTRCTETYSEGRPNVVLFGIPLWSMKSSPRNAIQPNMHPGECWAFKGSQGYLVIELSSPIRPTAFAIEHIPKSLSPTGSIDSAPKEFTVMGLQFEKDKNGVILGEYMYDKEGEPLQHFPVKEITSTIFPYIELQINSNHGDLKYTCLYRFRVHGSRS